MTYKTFYSKIIAMLPSADLRATVKNGNWVFSETDLLKFIDGRAPTFNKKIELFDMAAEVFSDKQTKYHAKKLAEHCRKVYDFFASPSADAVYVIEIRCSWDGGDSAEILVNKTLDDALTTLRTCARRDRRNMSDGEFYKYEIKKHSLVCAHTYGNLNNAGEICSCKWHPKLGIVDINSWQLKNEFGVDCNTCVRKNVCLDSHDVKYPVFLQPYDLVAYKTDRFIPIEYNKYEIPIRYTDIAYGVLCCDITRDDNNYSSYVIPLDSKYIKQRRADEQNEDGDYMVYFDHNHPQYAELYKPNRSEVPDAVYADYLYAADELKKIDMLASSTASGQHPCDDYCPKRHIMHLAPQPFRLIASGKKTVEIRLNDEKRRTIRRGDTILFTLGECVDTLTARVTGIQRFSTFSELMRSDLFEQTGSDGYTPEQAAESMYKYYTRAQEKSLGVLAIEIELIEDR